MTKKTTVLRIANTVAFVATVAVNILANALPIGGMNTGQISAMYPTLFTPAAITFSIWAVIYVMLGIFILMQFLSASMKDTESIGIYFILSCIFNISWIFAWHNQMIILSTLLIVLLLGTLMKIYSITRNSSMLPKITFGIYYAWITVATMISVFVVAKSILGKVPVTPIEPRTGISRIGEFTEVILVAGNPEIVSYVTVLEYVAATAAVVLTAAITIWHIMKFKDYFYTGTILWAMSGIVIKQITAPVQPTIMLIVAVFSMAAIIYAAARIMPLRTIRITKPIIK